MGEALLFFGNERLATGASTDAPILRSLIEAGYDIRAVVVAQNESGKSRKGRELEVAAVAEQHAIPVISPVNLRESTDALAAYGADAAVLVAYGKIVPEAVINLFPRGIINIHPSMLPKHRGPTPLESVILSGELETGVSLMSLAPKMDAGPVYAQHTVSLNGDETKQQLADRLSLLGRDMLLQYLPGILSGAVEALDQDDGSATCDQLINKEDSQLDYNKPAEQLAREVRAYVGWPRSKITIGAQAVIVTRAHAQGGEGTAGTLWLESKQLGIYTATGILAFDSLIPEGKKEMDASAFMAGYKSV